MSENLLKSLSEIVSPSLISKMGGILGEKQESVTNGVAAAIPSLLSSIVDKGSTESGAQGLLDFIGSNNYDGGMLSNLSGLFDGAGSASLMNQGSGILNMLMGGKSSGVMSLLAKLTGLSNNSSNGIMKMLAPIVMSFIGKKVMGKGLGVSGLMSLLGDQKSFLKGALPKGMGSALGLSSGLSALVDNGMESLGNAGNRVASSARTMRDNVSDAGRSTTNKGKSSSGKWWPWLLGLLLLLGLFYLIKGCGGTGIDAVDKVAEKTTEAVDAAANKTTKTVENVAEATGDAVKSIGSFVSEATMKTLAGIKFAAGSAGEQFYNWIRSGGDGEKAFAFKYLNFATGKAEISDAGKNELNNFARILDEIKDINVEVSGHTDKTGNESANLELSQKRADAIKAYLISKGISGNRIQAMGYGSSKPIASNETEEGRLSNRRCEVSVIYK